VDPELRHRVVGAVRPTSHGIDAFDLAVHVLDPAGGGVRGLEVAERRRRHVVRGAPKAVQGAIAVVAVLGDSRHGERVERLDDQGPQAADDAHRVADDLPGHRIPPEQSHRALHGEPR
jgi:hypothetical protein